jgi:hypothetical protein
MASNHSFVYFIVFTNSGALRQLEASIFVDLFAMGLLPNSLDPA